MFALLAAGALCVVGWRHLESSRGVGDTPVLSANQSVKVAAAPTPVDRAAESLKAAQKAPTRAEKIKLFRGVSRDYESTWAGKRANLELGFELADSRETRVEARNAISDGLSACKDAEELRRARSRLEELNEYLVFMPADSTDVVRYEVERNDSLDLLARRFNTTAEFLRRINGKTNSALHVGDKINVPSRRLNIKVTKSAFDLEVYYGDYYLKSYKVGIGRNDKTPEGEFVIGLKQKDPDWWPGNGKRIPHESPQNPLGSRWMGFANKPGASGFGIHGTKEPDTIGKEASNGCIRMRNTEVEELYDMIPVGTKVMIVP